MLSHYIQYVKNIAVRRRCLIKSSIFILMLTFSLCGCGGANSDDNAAELVAGKNYVYTGDSFSNMEGDSFSISINEDGTYSYAESVASSYLGFGTWEIKDGVLALTDNAQGGFAIQNFFLIDGEELVFVEEGSSNFIYMKIQDRERFVSTGDTEG